MPMLVKAGAVRRVPRRLGALGCRVDVSCCLSSGFHSLSDVLLP